MTPQEVFERMRASLARVFRIPETRIRPDSSLLEDLKAESIDIAELELVLEELFEIEVYDETIEAYVMGDLTKEQFYDEERAVTPDGLRRLSEVIPGFESTEWSGELNMYNLWHIFTVETLCRYVSDALNAASTSASIPTRL